MKGSILTTLIVTGALACSLTLTGCNEKNNKATEAAQVVNPTKLQPNNWNCRGNKFYSGSPIRRLRQQELEGKINDADLFLKKCKEQKLGLFNPIVDKAKTTPEREMVIAQWQKDAGVNPNDY